MEAVSYFETASNLQIYFRFGIFDIIRHHTCTWAPVALITLAYTFYTHS